MNAFTNASPNGTWSLYVEDNVNGDQGRIDGGWSLSFIAANPLASSADVQLTAVASPTTAAIGSNVTITVTAVNNGPADSGDVLIMNQVPAGSYLVSAIASQGSVSQSGNSLVCDAGNLASGDFATLTLVVKVAATDVQTNFVSGFGVTQDPNAANNAASALVTPAGPPQLQIAAPPPPPSSRGPTSPWVSDWKAPTIWGRPPIGRRLTPRWWSRRATRTAFRSAWISAPTSSSA